MAHWLEFGDKVMAIRIFVQGWRRMLKTSDEILALGEV
jgi:hypothetical protein